MLVQFSVENYLSINEEQILSLLATRDSQHAAHLISDTPRKGDSILRTAAIYGANGSGKSNLVKAMKFAQDFILTGTRGRQAILTRPFKLRADVGAPSKFEFIFKTQGVVYNYGFRLDSARIVEEWLFATPKTQEVLFFQRTTSESGHVEVEFGASFTERTAKHKQFLEFVAEGTRPNQLFLTEAVERNVSAVRPVIDWFKEVLLILTAEFRAKSLELTMHGSEAYTDLLKEWLQKSGSDIIAVTTEEVPFSLEQVRRNLTEVDKAEISKLLEERDAVMITETAGSIIYLIKGKGGEPSRIQIKMQHRGADGRLVAFDIEDESEGMQRLIHLLPALSMLKTQSEAVIVLDELDRRFHTLLTRFIIQSALECDDAHQHSQFVFTTHDTNLLDLDLLRRDEIWFMEKEPSGASKLYSLAEFKIRTDLKIEKGYLAGRFGAIPFAANPMNLGWHERSQSVDPEPCREFVGSVA
jgi:AAA15 family ATPase/GTPase